MVNAKALQHNAQLYWHTDLLHFSQREFCFYDSLQQFSSATTNWIPILAYSSELNFNSHQSLVFKRCETESLHGVSIKGKFILITKQNKYRNRTAKRSQFVWLSLQCVATAEPRKSNKNSHSPGSLAHFFFRPQLTLYQYYSLGHCYRNYINHCPLNFHCTEINPCCSAMTPCWPSFDNRINVYSLSIQIQDFRWKTFFWLSFVELASITRNWKQRSFSSDKFSIKFLLTRIPDYDFDECDQVARVGTPFDCSIISDNIRRNKFICAPE